MDIRWSTRRTRPAADPLCKSGYGVSSTPNATAGQNYVIDEDCLNINVIRPAGTSSGDDLPILFWIYGGKAGCVQIGRLSV